MVDISFKRTLKETSPYDMPYIQGLMESKALLTDIEEIEAAERYIEAWVTELANNYIGVAQDTSAVFTVTLPAASFAKMASDIDISDIKLYDEIAEMEYTAESLRPRDNLALKQAGHAMVEEIAAEVATASIAEFTSQSALLPVYQYDRIRARDYARKWSCDKGISTDHATCHNPAYDYYVDSDCANFVSQCLAAGGIPTDNVWYPKKNAASTAWNTTGNNSYGLRDYVVDVVGFYHTTDDLNAFAGSIINQLKSNGANAGHVGLVDQNDTRVMTFCAHTNCRKSKVFSFLTYRDFYVPKYDSESGIIVA